MYNRICLILLSGILILTGCNLQLTDEARPWKLHIIDSTLYGADGIRAGHFNQDTLVDFISGGEEYGATRVFLNRGNFRFEVKEFPSPHVEDALFADLNGDDIPEVLTFSEGTTQHIALHFNQGDPDWQSVVIPSTEGIAWMYGKAVDLERDGTMEILAGAKGDNALLGWLETSSDLQKTEQWVLHTIAPVAWVMSIEYLDIDGDGHKDVLVSDRKGSQSGVKWFKNPDTDSLTQLWEETVIGLSGKEPMFLDVVDFDGDGEEDIVATDIAEGVFLYKRTDDSGRKWSEKLLFAYPEMAGTRGKAVACTDLDKDGTLEVITSYEEAGDRNGVIYSKYNDDLETWEHFPVSGIPGIKYDLILLFDIDGDGDLDIFTTEERENGTGLGVIWYENPTTGNGTGTPSPIQ